MIEDPLLIEAPAPQMDVTARPRVSVVMPARNAAETIAQQLDALAGQEYEGDWELVIADNGSTDTTRQIAESFADRLACLRLVDAGHAGGINRARNAGWRAAAGDVVLFCDADDVVASVWIAALVRGLDAYDAVGGPIDVTSLNGAASEGLRGPPPQDSLPTHIDFLPRAHGANMGFRRRVLEALDGFDEQFDFGGDEGELFWRLQLAGYQLGFVPNALVQYRYRSGLRAGIYQLYRYGRSDAQLYRAFRDHGMPRSGRDVLRRWGWLGRHLPDLARGRYRRLRWIGRATLCLGRVVGSVRHRVVYL